MLDIKARMFSRKLVFLYFYQKYFTEYLWNKDILFSDILKIDKIINWNEPTELDLENIKKDIETLYSFEDSEDDLMYMVDNFFESPDKKIDFDYIKLMLSKYSDYKKIVEDLVNSYATSFSYMQMDLVDRVVFLLWYIEFKEIKTPKNVILNEMINFSKRYWDSWSYKLINGIWHKILN